MSVFGILFDHAMSMLVDIINAGCVDDAIAKARRAALVGFLNHAPVLCRELSRAAHTDARYRVVMFYEKVRLGVARAGYFLEGAGSGVAFFGTGQRPALATDAIARLGYVDLLKDRESTIQRLENMPAKEVGALEEQMPVLDVVVNVPARAKIFLARCRQVADALTAAKPGSGFAQCGNRCCNRRFFVPELGTESLNALAEPTYWELCGIPKTKTVGPKFFCSWSCENEFQAQLCAALPKIDESFLDSDRVCRNEDRARVVEASRLSVKRNEVAARHLRTIEKQCRRFPALGREVQRRERARRVRALNLDLGLLFAASVLAESKSLSQGRVLPGTTLGWRTRPRFYAAALGKVAALYDRLHKNDSVISNLLVSSRFLLKLREQAIKLF